MKSSNYWRWKTDKVLLDFIGYNLMVEVGDETMISTQTQMSFAEQQTKTNGLSQRK